MIPTTCPDCKQSFSRSYTCSEHIKNRVCQRYYKCVCEEQVVFTHSVEHQVCQNCKLEDVRIPQLDYSKLKFLDDPEHGHYTISDSSPACLIAQFFYASCVSPNKISDKMHNRIREAIIERSKEDINDVDIDIDDIDSIQYKHQQEVYYYRLSMLRRYQQDAVVYCPHSSLGKAFKLHLNDCQQFKQFEFESFNCFNHFKNILPNVETYEDIFYWTCFSPQTVISDSAYAEEPMYSDTIMPVHPILSLSGSVRVLSRSMNVSVLSDARLVHRLMKLELLPTDFRCKCTATHQS